jgi:hypothetical protein
MISKLSVLNKQGRLEKEYTAAYIEAIKGAIDLK